MKRNQKLPVKISETLHLQMLVLLRLLPLLNNQLSELALNWKSFAGWSLGKNSLRAVAQLVKLTLDTRSLNPVISKFMFYQLYCKDENKEKMPGMAHF